MGFLDFLNVLIVLVMVCNLFKLLLVRFWRLRIKVLIWWFFCVFLSIFIILCISIFGFLGLLFSDFCKNCLKGLMFFFFIISLLLSVRNKVLFLFMVNCLLFWLVIVIINLIKIIMNIKLKKSLWVKLSIVYKLINKDLV